VNLVSASELQRGSRLARWLRCGSLSQPDRPIGVAAASYPPRPIIFVVAQGF
jgi:hypothetical protein